MEWVGTVCRPDPLCKISTVGTWNRKLGINNIIYVGLLVPIDLLREMIRSTEKRKREVKVHRLVTTCYTIVMNVEDVLSTAGGNRLDETNVKIKRNN